MSIIEETQNRIHGILELKCATQIGIIQKTAAKEDYNEKAKFIQLKDFHTSEFIYLDNNKYPRPIEIFTDEGILSRVEEQKKKSEFYSSKMEKLEKRIETMEKELETLNFKRENATKRANTMKEFMERRKEQSSTDSE